MTRGATVILEVPRPLLEVLGDVEGVSHLIVEGAALPPFDYHCPLMSLPAAFNTRPETIPAAGKYLRSDPGKVEHWRARLGERSRPRIGLVWSGNADNPLDQRRSIELAAWIEHLPQEFQYFCLQKDVRAADQAVLDSSEVIFSYDSDLLSFANTAALCECMDVILTVDTSLAHLSGALGLRAWLLLPFNPDWRWMTEGDSSLWYPSMKLYRQVTSGDWNGVFERVAAELRLEFLR